MSEAFDIVKFRDFCAGKPAGERYNWGSRQTCALAQFGFVGVRAGDPHVPADVYRVAVMMRPATFGALASRLSALIREGGNVD